MGLRWKCFEFVLHEKNEEGKKAGRGRQETFERKNTVSKRENRRPTLIAVLREGVGIADISCRISRLHRLAKLRSGKKREEQTSNENTSLPPNHKTITPALLS